MPLLVIVQPGDTVRYAKAHISQSVVSIICKASVEFKIVIVNKNQS